jgi:beta-glucosidase-like glycosyl hydrolase
LTLAAFAQALLAALGLAGQPPEELASLTPREKAALVVVSGLPAPPGVGGVFVRPWDRDAPRPAGALVFVDQEGADVRAFPDLPPRPWPSAYATAREAFAAGRETGVALRRAGVHVDLAPVLDTAGGPLGARHFREPRLALAFARGLRAGGTAGCVKHFPGLGTASVSTDNQVRVPARITKAESQAFRRAIEDGVACVMTSHALYRRYGWQRAVIAPAAYRSLRELGFEGVIVTDSLNVVSSGPWSMRWARSAALAGADLLLFTSPVHARRAIEVLVPPARRGLLDDQVARVLELRRKLGVPTEQDGDETG